MGRSRLDLNLLETFDAVCLSGSLKKAADHLNLSHSTVSMQIKRLEEAVEQQLLERNNQGLRITAAGEYLLRRSHSLLRLEASTISDLMRRQVVGTMRIGVPSDYAPALLSVALPYLSANFPEVQVTIECDLSRKLRPKIAAQQLDVAIVALDRTPPDGELLWEEELLWIQPRRMVGPDHLLAAGLLDVDCFIRDAALQTLEAAAGQSRVAFRSTNLASIVSAVQSGFCASLIPRSALGPDFSSGEDFSSSLVEARLHVALITSESDRPEIPPFRDFLLKTLKLTGNLHSHPERSLPKQRLSAANHPKNG